MPNIPSIGVFVPNGYLNLGSFAGPSGQQDAYGNNYPSGLTPGKMIMLGTAEAQAVALPGTTLLDGCYQCVLLDSGATAALAGQGYALYVKLDSGATQGAVPMTEWDNMTVTTADQAGSTDLDFFAGIGIDPVTYNGISALPVPGQYCFIFVGAGRAYTKYTGNATVGNQVVPSGASNGEFTPQAAAASIYPAGVAMQTTTAGAGSIGVSQWSEIFYRVGNQGV